MTFTYRHRKKLMALLFGVLLLFSFVFYTFPKLTSTNKTKEKKQVLLAKKEEPIEKEEPKKAPLLYQVDIKGAVVNPGIYSVEEGSRVIDVIRMAGNLLEEADTTVINLSKKVFDEMVIIIYTKEEVADFKRVKEVEAKVQEECQNGNLGSLSNDACIEEESSQKMEGKISLNQATKEELMMLSGIGEAKAEAIIQYREKHGPFKSIEELKEVDGIGDALFNQVQENITL